MKLHKTIFIFCLFLIGSASFFLIQHSGAQEQNQQIYDVACEVKDVTTLKDCVEQVKAGKYNLIKITAIIACVSKDDCAIDLSNIPSSLKIYGISNTATGFRRTGNFDYTLFTLKNAKDLVLGSFLIDDTASGDCTALGLACPPAILIDNSKNITIDQLKTTAIKSNALSVTTSSSVVIKNSIFSNSNGSAVLFAADGGKNSIENNTFVHNHQQAIFEDCTTGTCIGAQLTILPSTKNLTIIQNTIKDGRIDVYDPLGLYGSGINIAGSNVENVTVSCNKISNNTGNGIVIGNQQSSTKTIRIEKNAVYGNGIDVNVVTNAQNTIQNNCSDNFCRVEGC